MPAPGTFVQYPDRLPISDRFAVEADWGRLFVPLHRTQTGPARKEDPSQPKPERDDRDRRNNADGDVSVVSVEVYRFASTRSVPSDRPPIFLLPGGPGFPGLSSRFPGFYERIVEPLREIADVVIVGQRGIGSSRPATRCQPPPSPPLDANVDEAQRLATIHDAALNCKTYWEEKGLDLTGFNVREAAADVADVAEAFGYSNITLLGRSFGSHWAIAVMREYPGLVERALLAGIEGPDHTYHMPSHLLNALRRVEADAATSEALKGITPNCGLIGALKESIAQREERPVFVDVSDPATDETVTVRFDGDDVRRLATGYTTPSTRHPLSAWPADILTIRAGNYTDAARERVRNHGYTLWRNASFLAMDCGSGVSSTRRRHIDRDPAAAVVGSLNLFYRATCSVWGVDLGDAFRGSFESEIPTVMVNGTWDLSTPLENARELIPSFPNGTLVEVKRGTHAALRQALLASSGFRTAVKQFLATGDRSEIPPCVELPPVQWETPHQSMYPDEPSSASVSG